jgi:hypothetical protein
VAALPPRFFLSAATTSGYPLTHEQIAAKAHFESLAVIQQETREGGV